MERSGLRVVKEKMRVRQPTDSRSGKRRRRPNRQPNIELPPVGDWRTTDEDEVNRRRLRARKEQPRIRNLDPKQPIFSNFEIRSRSGMTYHVEIRDIARRPSRGAQAFRAPMNWLT